MESVYDAYVEAVSGGQFVVSVAELPGCRAIADNESVALDRLVACIPRYFAWLQRQDEYTPVVSGPFAVRVRERQTVARVGAGFFEPDAAPMDAGDFDWLAALIAWTNEDLATFVQRAGATPLSRPILGETTPAAVAVRLFHTQYEWLAQVEPSLPAPQVSVSDPRLAAQVRSALDGWLARFAALNEEERSRVVERAGERWSLRKALRLCISETLDRTEALAELLS